ncbi:A/G-specific adenine glycosylase [Candidatus Kaiserbacteria bacterium]|nr:A/G-specific adenine glycosylase [Candidatus Kaiserbacteria bacterium]
MPRFREMVWKYYRKHGRHDLPWRRTRDPYKILVSEVMLQQTRVERVIPFYNKFIGQFPTARRLSAAPLGSVLEAWQGLGYNRRARMLRAAAQEVGHGVFPKRVEELAKLPGVGPYTARAVAAFAYNQNVVFVETNIRTAVLQYFFANKKRVSDKEIEKILARALPAGRAREWYSALMDYGAHLKASGVRLNAKSKQYAKQSRFAGSLREARGAILRALAYGSRAQASLINLLGSSRRPQLRTALAALAREGLVQKRGKIFTLPR